MYVYASWFTIPQPFPHTIAGSNQGAHHMRTIARLAAAALNLATIAALAYALTGEHALTLARDLAQIGGAL